MRSKMIFTNIETIRQFVFRKKYSVRISEFPMSSCFIVDYSLVNWNFSKLCATQTDVNCNNLKSSINWLLIKFSFEQSALNLCFHFLNPWVEFGFASSKLRDVCNIRIFRVVAVRHLSLVLLENLCINIPTLACALLRRCSLYKNVQSHLFVALFPLFVYSTYVDSVVHIPDR